MKHFYLAAATTLALVACTEQQYSVSPIQISILDAKGGGSSMLMSYNKEGKGFSFAEITRLGLITPQDSASVWSVTSTSEPVMIHESYDMLIGKKLHCENDGQQVDYMLDDGEGHKQRLEVRTYTDGVAFRYVLCDGYETPQPLMGEQTTLQFHFDDGCHRWLMHWTEPYEDFYPKNPEEKENAHWGYPALFNPKHQGEAEPLYVLLSEANIEKGHSASSFYTSTLDGTGYRIQPDLMESQVQTGWATPWRVLITGSLGEVVESTLITDLAEPCKLEDTSWIKPGVVSWIYWAYNHGSNDYQIIKEYIDMGEKLHLPYMLIDAEWDEMGNGGTIEDALNYAHEHGVKPLIWYNSTTAWIDWAPGPKYRLNDPEKREAEFQWCEDHGVAGVKIDFFQGDRESAMNYCIDLLESAARHHLLVNFHGATIPRGWFRTYPNLVSTEAVYGAEWYNNLPVLTNRAAAHNATIPFTRNVIGSMDYTPCTFTDSQHPHITTHAHELALTVLFESGLQHLADRPSSYLSQPQEVQDFLSSLPSVWDETHLVSGDPGQHAVLARRSGDTWYIAGINGTDEQIELELDLTPYVASDDKITLFQDSGLALDTSITDPEKIASYWFIHPWPTSVQEGEKLTDFHQKIQLQPRGGFVLEIK